MQDPTMAIITSGINAAAVTVAALIVGGAVLYYRYRLTLPTQIGLLLIGACGVVGTIGVILGNSEINLQSGTGLGVIVIIATVLLFIILGITFFLYLVLFKPLREFASISRKLADGVIDLQIPEYNRPDEIGDLSKGFTEMLSFLNLREFVGRIKEVINHVFSSSEEMSSSAEEVNATSQEISSISQQMSIGAQQQSQQIHDAVKESELLRSQFEEKITSINNASSLIETMSSQVNMLALNASIEAARAGEYGRGFAVVADNIRRLADETKQSLITINQSIDDLKGTLSDRINSIIKTVQNVDSISEETATGAEEASAATEEQAASMQELSATSQELVMNAEKLNELTRGFKT